MKKIILIIAMVALGGFINNAKADPCYFGNIGVDVKSTYSDGLGRCVIVFDFYFDIRHNSGGKFFWVHIWPTGQYTGNFSYAKPPTYSTSGNGNGYLINSLATFGFFHQGTALDPQLTYLPDPTVPGFQSSYTITEIQGTPDRYTIKGLTITLPLGCGVPQSLTADAWESQSDQSQTVGCFSTNFPFYINDPGLRGFLFCKTPRTYAFDIYTISASDMSVTYKVAIDNGDGIYNALTDNIIVNGPTTTTLNAGNSYKFQSGELGYLPYSNQKPEADRSLWVVVTTPSRPNEFYALITNSCSPLPVQFASFTALRNKENVALKWVTASELNNKGFYIERKSGNSEWQVMAYITSQAADGNSNENLFYNYIDYNNLKAVSQYRIRQVDLDNKASYSDIRLVKGLEQTGNVVVFPNPSPDGQLNIVLDNIEGGATIRLIDMNGRVVKEWINVTTNKLNINYVSSGMYTLRVWIKGTNEPLNVKVMVSK